jgi:ATP-dependent helicase/nuclease subunit B
MGISAPASPFALPTVRLEPGARAAEDRLVAELGEALEWRRSDPRGLARPLRVVVPSGSLRQHLNAELLRRWGRPLVGLVVQTHWGAALEVLERAGRSRPEAEVLVPVWVRRLARSEPVLRAALEPLREGYGVAEGAVRDLLDAGFEPAHREAIEDLFRERGGPAAERAAAVVRVATGVALALEDLGVSGRSALLSRARQVLEHGGPGALPSRAVWVHGFADATGVAADWLEALLRHVGARAIVPVPADPASPDLRPENFSAALVERLGRVGGVDRSASPPAGLPARLVLVRAPGSGAEVRAAAERIRSLLDGGARPEGIGVVARHLEPYRVALRTHFDRLGVPFSAPGTPGPPDPASRRIGALVRLLAEVEDTAIDRWLDADARPASGDPDLRVALHVLGTGRMRDLADVDLDAACGGREWLPLPVGRGSSVPDDGGEEGALEEGGVGESLPRKRKVDRGRLERLRERALALLGQLGHWPVWAPCADHLRRLAELLEHDLGWRRADPGLARAFDALEQLASRIPAELRLERDEWNLVVERELERAARPPLGGAGAGVQVLPVMGARGRTFDHLFLLGLNRDVFPRVPSDDPLLPDELGRLARVLLPDLPVKARAREEERHLFADLLSASPSVWLSWQHASDDGRQMAESPLLVRLRQAHPTLEEQPAHPLVEPLSEAHAPETGPRPAHEHALLNALAVRRRGFTAVRAVALQEVRARLDEVGRRLRVHPLARAHREVLDELDPDPATPAGRRRATLLGPYFGFVGRAPGPGEPGYREPYVTRLEAMARCPWQAFLRRELRLEPLPDALDALPVLEARVLGSVVHRVLEGVVTRCLSGEAGTLALAHERGPSRVPWPAETDLEALLEAEARGAAAEEGIRGRAFVRALVLRARACVEAARAVDWGDGELRVLGAEVTGSLEIEDAAGCRREIRFRADRADVRDGTLRLTDYKTGAPLSRAAKPARRAEHLRKSTALGTALQATAYLLAAQQLAGSERVEGRLLFLAPDLPDELRELRAMPGDLALEEAFGRAARGALTAAELGTCFPRLVEVATDEEPAACRFCEVSDACLRGDSGHRMRLRAWVVRETARGDAAARSPLEQAFLELYQLGRRSPATGGGTS